MSIQAIILDFDGLILDTETPIFEAWRSVFREHRQELSLERWGHTLGSHGVYDPCAHLCELTGEELDRQALRLRVHQQHVDHCERQPLLPGVRQLLADAGELGLQLAVASSSSRGWVERWLGRHQIRSLFAAVCARDDVEQVKPAPDLYLLAAARLGLAPEACLVFEDSPNGMRAARRAGMRCVAVPNELTRRLSLPDPDLVVGSLAELPLSLVLERVGRAADVPPARM